MISFKKFLTEEAETYKTRKVYKLGKRPDGVHFTAERSWDQTDDANYDKKGNPVDDDGWFVFAHDPSHKYADGREKTVGHLHVPYDNMCEGHFHAGDVQVDDTHKRRGIATDMFKHMAKHLSKMEGQTMTPEPSSTQSDDGKAMWNGFKKKKIFEETPMTRKLTLSVVEQEKKVAQLTEETKDLPMFDAAQKFADAGIELNESVFDDRVNSKVAMDRFYIATHGTDAHRDQLVKDEDALVRFGVAKTGHMQHLSQLAHDPSPMVRDQVARRGDEDLAKKLSEDPHPMVRSSAYNRMQEIRRTIDDPAVISSANGVNEGVEAPKHFEADETVQVKADGRFATVKTFFEAKEGGFWYAVTLPGGGSEVLHESEVRSLEERHGDTDFGTHRELSGEADSRPDMNKPVKLKKADGTIHSTHDNEHSAMQAYKNEPDNKGMKIVRESLCEDRENEFHANLSLSGDRSTSKPNKPVKLKRADGTVHSEHDNEHSALQAYKNEPDNKGMKIVREAVEEIDPASILESELQEGVHNECPFCNPALMESADQQILTEEHEAALVYHDQQAQRADLPATERHFHVRCYNKHKRSI
jgi:hypothetical protein